MASAEPRLEIEALLYREARLLDERRFNEWLELFCPDIRYWMPAPENVSGKREDRLRRIDGQWKIARRTIVLAQAMLPRTLSIFF